MLLAADAHPGRTSDATLGQMAGILGYLAFSGTVVSVGIPNLKIALTTTIPIWVPRRVDYRRWHRFHRRAWGGCVLIAAHTVLASWEKQTAHAIGPDGPIGSSLNRDPSPRREDRRPTGSRGGDRRRLNPVRNRRTPPSTPPGVDTAWRRHRLASTPPGVDTAWRRHRLASTPPGVDTAWRRHRLASTPPGVDTAWRRHRLASALSVGDAVTHGQPVG
ncbi:hypothetical protein [Frankia tisae]|uniref:hypothetical protein n=1 Tax=Frankia tisae TaxID=2950104 RepID=UPI0021BE1CF4|nr:hypothetical protein [Frankia tisae]